MAIVYRPFIIIEIPISQVIGNYHLKYICKEDSVPKGNISLHIDHVNIFISIQFCYQLLIAVLIRDFVSDSLYLSHNI